MWRQLVYISCWLMLASALDTDANVAEIENILLAAADGKKNEAKPDGRTGEEPVNQADPARMRFLENFKQCDHENGEDARCVKKSLCQVTPPPVDPATTFTYRELVEGGCTYLQICCPEDKIRNEPKKEKVQKPRGCGYSNPGANVLRELADQYGYADYGDFPWMVALIKKNGPKGSFNDAYIGGGTLIDPSVVLTVAHKVDEISANQVSCRAGEWDTKTEDEFYKHQDRDVKQIVLHSEFNRLHAHNDVALLILKEPFALGDAPHIGVACLEPRLPPAGTECVSMGWGKDFVNGETYAHILKKIKMPLVDAYRCQNLYRNSPLGQSYTLHKSLTCAGGQENVDTCVGDGGSSLVCPLVDKSGLRYSVVGMVAYGLNCGTENLPGVYVKIPEVYDWIFKEMATQGFDTKTFVKN